MGLCEYESCSLEAWISEENGFFHHVNGLLLEYKELYQGTPLGF